MRAVKNTPKESLKLQGKNSLIRKWNFTQNFQFGLSVSHGKSVAHILDILPVS